MKYYLVGAFLTTLLLTGCASSNKDSSFAYAAPRELLVGNWIGQCGNGVNFYYLSLKADGDGALACLYENKVTQVYRIKKWGFEGGRLKAQWEDRDLQQRPVTIALDFRDPYIVMHARGQGWDHSCLMARDSLLTQKAAIATEAIGSKQ
jgi:hypothetical protein